MLLTNQKVKSDGRKREPYEIVYALVGALGIWAGREPVVHFLQLLNVIKMDSNIYHDRTKKMNSGSSDFSPLQEEEEKENSYKTAAENLKEEQSNGKFYSQPQDYLLFEQVYQYLNSVSSSIEIELMMEKVPQIEDIEKKVALILSSNKSLQLEK